MAIKITNSTSDDSSLYQWDVGRKITISGFPEAVAAVDFVNIDSSSSTSLAHRVDVTIAKGAESTVTVPEVALQKAGTLEVYVMGGTTSSSGVDKCYCLEMRRFPIIPRSNTIEAVLAEDEVLATTDIVEDWNLVNQLEVFHYRGMTPGIIVAAGNAAAMYNRGKFLAWQRGDVLLDIENKHLYVYSVESNDIKGTNAKWLDLGVLWYVDAESNLIYWDGRSWRVTKFFYNLTDLEDLANGSFRYTGTVYCLTNADTSKLNTQLGYTTTPQTRLGDTLENRFKDYMKDSDPSHYIGNYTAVEYTYSEDKKKYLKTMNAYIFGRIEKQRFDWYAEEAKKAGTEAEKKFNDRFHFRESRGDPINGKEYTYFFEDVLSLSELVAELMLDLADDYPMSKSNNWVLSKGIYEVVNRNLQYNGTTKVEATKDNLRKLWYAFTNNKGTYTAVVRNGNEFATATLLTLPHSYNFMAAPSTVIQNDITNKVPSLKAVYNNVNRTLIYKKTTVFTTKNDLWYATENDSHEYKAVVENGDNTTPVILLKNIGYDFMAEPSYVLAKNDNTKVPSIGAVFANVNRKLQYTGEQEPSNSKQNDLWYTTINGIHEYIAKVENDYSKTSDEVLLASVGYNFMAAPQTSLSKNNDTTVPSTKAVKTAVEGAKSYTDDLLDKFEAKWHPLFKYLGEVDAISATLTSEIGNLYYVKDSTSEQGLWANLRYGTENGDAGTITHLLDCTINPFGWQNEVDQLRSELQNLAGTSQLAWTIVKEDGSKQEGNNQVDPEYGIPEDTLNKLHEAQEKHYYYGTISNVASVLPEQKQKICNNFGIGVLIFVFSSITTSSSFWKNNSFYYKVSNPKNYNDMMNTSYWRYYCTVTKNPLTNPPLVES